MKKIVVVHLTLLQVLITSIIIGCGQTSQLLPGGINSNSTEEYPNYSGNGNYLVFASDRNGQRDIFLYDFTQRQLVPLPNLNRNNSSQDQPSISQDGRYIAYVSTERGKSDIFVYDRQRQRTELISSDIKGSTSHPTISGDGSKVAFQASQLGQWKIVLVERNVN
ncbi:MAG: biopolymer transporter [Xenococcaceae cyanobacterium MO_188.B19]|nr:biopolymer transporter [Xenococcaceae cyanobacterium MO_188.B19]